MNDKIKNAIEIAVNQINSCFPKFENKFPYSNSENNFYKASDNVEWSTGFWTGEIWLAYEYTKDEKFKEIALKQVESFKKRIENKIDVNHHDMGFLYSPSCVAAYKLVKSNTAKEAALLASENLISRYQEKGEFIQAWGNLGDDNNYRLIIDCLLNLPLLFWATETTKNQKYRTIALKHISTAMKVILKDDNSTYHTYYFDKKTGLPLQGVTRQGNRDDSAWARGQAWGIYGSALAYSYTKNYDYIEKFKKMCDFFISHLPSDYLPYWDFDFSDGSKEPRDSSASAIAICGIYEMIKYLNYKESTYYKEIADKLLNVLIDKCQANNPKESNGLLLHGTYARKSKYNPCNNRGVDECNTWGDFFYFEALMRAYKNWDSYW